MDPEKAPALVLTSAKPKWGWLFFISIALGSLFAFLMFGVNLADVAKNWPKYRCNPLVIPFASFYGYNTSENFNFCVQGLMKNRMGTFTGPFATILGSFATSLMIILQSVNSIRLMLATLYGGITKTFQEITTKFQGLISQLAVSRDRTKMMMNRMMSIFYAVVYAGTAGMTAGMNFSRTSLFGFLNTFCFAPETLITLENGSRIPIKDVQVGMLLKSRATVTAVYQIQADGQSMRKMEGNEQTIYVSSNHYIKLFGKWLLASDHPKTDPAGNWSGGWARPLICLDTTTHEIEIDGIIFSDYQETDATDHATMKLVDERLNNGRKQMPLPDEVRYEPGVLDSQTIIMKDGSLKAARSIKLGDTLKTGQVYGIVERYSMDLYEFPNLKVTGATSIWNQDTHAWERAAVYPNGTKVPGLHLTRHFLVPGQATVATPFHIVRDCLEVHSPDMEEPTATALLSPE